MKLALVLVTLLSAPAALACGDGAPPQNLRATAAVKAGLTAAYDAAHPSAHATAPLAGRTFYGREDGYEFAVATLGAHPSVFSRAPGGRWHLDRDTNGAICADLVPTPLLVQTWWFAHRTGGCYAEG